MQFINALNICFLPRTVIRVTGKDRLRVINNFFTNQIDGFGGDDPAKAAGIEGLFTNAKGRIHAHAFVYVFADHLLIETFSRDAENLVQHIDKYVISEKIKFETLGDVGGNCLTVYGDSEAVSKALEIEQDNQCWAIYQNQDDHNIYQTTHSLLGWPTVSQFAEETDQQEFLKRCTELGAVERTATEFEHDRITAGVPMFGRDFSDANFPQELGRDDDLISFTKGCYLGQETIARIDSLGHVNKFICSVMIEGEFDTDELPIELKKDTKNVGKLTSLETDSGRGGRRGIAAMRVPYHQTGNKTETNIGIVTVL